MTGQAPTPIAEAVAKAGGAKNLLRLLTADDAAAVLYCWEAWARSSQLPPTGDWDCWLILAGRGFGKTRTGAEWVRAEVERLGAVRVALVGRTAADVRDTMIEGESGLLSVYPPSERPQYEPSKRRLTFANGATATAYCAETPDQLRGPQHHLAWADELASWKHADTWDMLRFGLRLGARPRVVVTTTPRPTRIIKSLVADSHVAVTRGVTHENAGNLPRAFLAAILDRYSGTRLGRQEIDAEILDEPEGALWQISIVDAVRVQQAPQLWRVVVAVDPAVSSGPRSNETGIVVVGLGDDGHGYVLADRSIRGTPAQWAHAVVDVYQEYQADRVIGEVNQGGDLVEANIRTVDSTIPYEAVHATRGKAKRAEPVAGLYEQGKIHHVGVLSALEDQMTQWSPGAARAGEESDSPDRVDALVWGLTYLLLGEQGGGAVPSSGREERRTKVTIGGWDGSF